MEKQPGFFPRRLRTEFRAEEQLKKFSGARINAGRFAFAWAADGKSKSGAHAAPLKAQPERRLLQRLRPGKVRDQKWLAVTVRKVLCQRRALGDLEAVACKHDHASIGVAYDPFGALRRVGELRLLQMRVFRQHAGRLLKILRPAAFRTPTAVADAARQRCG